MKIAFVFTLGTLAALSATSVSAAPLVLQSHRAVYDVTLSQTRPGAMAAVGGRTVIEFRDVCTGYTTAQRFIADMTTAQGETTRNDFSISQSEGKDGKLMRFKIASAVNGKTTEKFTGIGDMTTTGNGQVKFTVPKRGSFVLPGGTLMPTQHTLEILKLAASGATSLRRMVYQGGDQKEVYDTTTLIGKKTGLTPEDRAVDKDGILKDMPAWSAMVSYFPHDSTDAAAEYEVAYRLYGNGVISSMTFIYSNFTLKAELTRLEKLPTKCAGKS